MNPELVEQLRRSAVQIVNGGGGGSGVVWDSDGSIVTNAHVLRGREAEVIDANGRRAKGRVTKGDSERDLALLETGLRGLEPAVFGDSDAEYRGFQTAQTRLEQSQIALAVTFGHAPLRPAAVGINHLGFTPTQDVGIGHD